ncbi:MAG: hypothetical protein KBS65_05165 [Prevotella sp.]|nr:hypothetical protein [Candidatus Equicola stercoris]
MITILVIITLALHAVLTLGGIKIWKTVEKTKPSALAKVFFISMAARLVMSVGMFLVALMLLKEDIDAIKMFTVFFVILYFLLLIFDTVYFYCSLKIMDNKNKKETNN